MTETRTETLLDRLLKPDEMPSEGINCLRCRHCQPLPHTDFSSLLSIRGVKVALDKDGIVPIHCAKSGRNRPAKIFGSCQVADPTRRYQNGGRGTGDRTLRASAVEKLFHQALYGRWPAGHLPDLCALVGRHPDSVGKIARGLGVSRLLDVDAVQARTQASLRARRSNGSSFNEAQSRYVCERNRAGEWPGVGGRMKGSYYRRRLALQNEIIEAVAALGPRWTWRQILVHVSTVSPAMRRKERRRHPRKFLRTGTRG